MCEIIKLSNISLLCPLWSVRVCSAFKRESTIRLLVLGLLLRCQLVVAIDNR